MKTRRRRDDIISVVIDTPDGQRSFSTGTKDPVLADEIIKLANVESIEALNKANALSHQMMRQLTPGGRMTVEDAVNEWVKWLEETANSIYTTHTYVSKVRSWAINMHIQKFRLCDVEEKHINRWLNGNEGKWGTRKSRRTALLHFFKYCTRIKQYLTHNPALEVRVKVNRMTHEQKLTKIREIITDEEFSRITNFLTMRLDFLNKSPWSEKHRYLIKKYTFWYCAAMIGRWSGLRFGDIAMLEWASVSLKDGYLNVCTDKSDTWVKIPIAEQLQKAIAAIPRQNGRYCFPEYAAQNKSIDRRNLPVQFSDILKTVGIHGKSFHCLRHSHASALAANGMRREKIAEMLGHKSTTTTDIYLHPIENQTK